MNFFLREDSDTGSSFFVIHPLKAYVLEIGKCTLFWTVEDEQAFVAD